MRLCSLALLIGLAWVTPAKADWINLTGAETSPNIAEVYILDDHVKLVLEIYVGDLQEFPQLIPDDFFKEKPKDRPALQQRLHDFSKTRFQLTTGSGERLLAESLLAEPRLRKDRYSPFAGMTNPYTGQRIAAAPADKRVLYAELIYPFGGKPDRITLTPPLQEDGRPRVSIGFIAYHKAVPVIDFRYLGTAVTVNLDWHDPWYTKFDNPNLKRHHKSALMSYLYIEPYEVRHEILVRVRDLEHWMDLGLRDREFIELDELEPLKRRVGEFLKDKNPVRIDGVAVAPILDRMDYVRVAITGIQILQQPERLETSTAILGVILAYITDGLPQEVTTKWELFTSQIQQVPATSIDPAGPLLTYVEPGDPIHRWTNFLKNYKAPTVAPVTADTSLTSVNVPVISLLCLIGLIPMSILISRQKQRRGSIAVIALLVVVAVVAFPFARVSIAKPGLAAPELADADAKAVLQDLLSNVYRAFDFREEEDVYDKLAHSVNGELLADVYLQNRQSMQIQRAGGAQARVKEVEVMEVTAERNPDQAFSYQLAAKWSALGTVGHWGHVHTRQNLYDAVITINVVDGVWKISALDVLEEKRVDPTTRR